MSYISIEFFKADSNRIAQIKRITIKGFLLSYNIYFVRKIINTLNKRK